MERRSALRNRFIPKAIGAVRHVVEERFGEHRLAEGENFQLVAFDFALIGLEDDLGPGSPEHLAAKAKYPSPPRMSRRGPTIRSIAVFIDNQD
jgi:hypothetical protein